MSDSRVVVPDGDVDLVLWKSRYATHFAGNQHVSESPFREYFGSVDRGCRLHIPPAGPERDKMNRQMEREAQAARSKALRAG